MPKAKPSKPKTVCDGDVQMELQDQPKRKPTPAKQPPEERIATPRQMGPLLWNRIVGLSALPFIPIFSMALYRTLRLAHAAKQKEGIAFWESHDFQMFTGGAFAWLVIFCLSLKIWKEPWGMRAYVLGHETMHMLVAMGSRGKIKEFSARREGGYVVTNKYNFLIALAPYLWPFYSMPVLLAWSLSLLCWSGAWEYWEWFLAALGFTWMFHLTFTVWILPFGQSDFHGPGRIFSLVVVYLANTVCLSGMIILLAPKVTWYDYGVSLWRSAWVFYQLATDYVVIPAARWLYHSVVG